MMAGVVLSGGVLTSPAFAGDSYLVFDDITRCLEGPFVRPPPSFNPGDVGCMPWSARIVRVSCLQYGNFHLQESDVFENVTIQVIPSSHNTVSVDRYEVPATGDKCFPESSGGD